MKEFEIWIEGYRATGEDAQAALLGKYYAETFDEAVDSYLNENPQGDYAKRERYGPRNSEGVMPLITVHSIWACRLYDNEADARKANG